MTAKMIAADPGDTVRLVETGVRIGQSGGRLELLFMRLG